MAMIALQRITLPAVPNCCIQTLFSLTRRLWVKVASNRSTLNMEVMTAQQQIKGNGTITIRVTTSLRSMLFIIALVHYFTNLLSAYSAQFTRPHAEAVGPITTQALVPCSRVRTPIKNLQIVFEIATPSNAKIATAENLINPPRIYRAFLTYQTNAPQMNSATVHMPDAIKGG